MTRGERPGAGAVGFGLYVFEEVEEWLYETMLYWETADQNPSLDYSTLGLARIPWTPG